MGGRGKEGETENRVGTLASREEGMIYTLGDKRAPRSMKSTIRVVLGSVLVTGRWPVPKLRAFVCVKGRQIDKSIALVNEFLNYVLSLVWIRILRKY